MNPSMKTTPRGRVCLVLGLVLVAAAFVAGTVEVRAGQHGCGSAVSAHSPEGALRGLRLAEVEDQCDSKIKSRRALVAILGTAGVILAVLGAYDHPRGARRPRGSG
jgi:hypothetical protein